MSTQLTTMTMIRPGRAAACLLGLLGLFAAAGAGGCAAANDKAVRLQADQFQTGLAPAEVPDPQVNDYLDRIGKRILAAGLELDRQKVGPKAHFDSGQDESWMFSNVQFHLVNSETLNAFTTGGNHVYIYNALLQLCQNEDQLAAVMAHEYAHIYCRHVQQGSSRQMYAAIPALLGAGAGYLVGGKDNGAAYAQLGAGAGGVVGQLGSAHFSRGDEDQADEFGQKFYAQAGWDPAHFGDFFQVLADKGGDSTPEILSDHPSLLNRVAKAKERAAKLEAKAERHRQPPVLSQADFARLRQQAVVAARGVPSDKSLENTKTLLQALPRSCLQEDNPNPPSAQQAQQRIQQNVDKANAAQPKGAAAGAK